MSDTTYYSKCAYKLWKQASFATAVTVLVIMNRYENTYKAYNSKTIYLPNPINSDLLIIKYANTVLRSNHEQRYSHKVYRLIISEFVPDDNPQMDLYNVANTANTKI